MKKSLVITFLVTALLALSFSLVMAKTEKVNLEGEITAVDEATPTITVTTADSEDFTIYFSPEYGFTFTQADVGSFVHVKAEYQEDGTESCFIIIDSYWSLVVDISCIGFFFE